VAVEWPRADRDLTLQLIGLGFVIAVLQFLTLAVLVAILTQVT
jgi:Na+-transporting methylmalonyl-CoA/oxaloacetate decarboxylase gamma subunit